MGFLGSVVKMAGDAYESVAETAGDVYEGAKDTVGGAVDTVSETAGDVYQGAKDTVGGAVDTVSETAGDAYQGAKDVAGGAIDTAVDAGPGLVDGALDWGRKGVDLVGNNIVGLGVDLMSKSPLKALGGPLSKVTGPIGLLSCALGTYDEAQNLGDPEEGQSQKNFDLNNFLSNGVGAVGGALSTASLAGGSLASLGPAGSVIGAGAAGLLGGQYMAEAADGENGRDENGRTTYDENTEAANNTRKWVNEQLGSDPDGLAGNIAGGVHAGVGGIGAGIVGGGRALANWAGGLF